MPFIECDSCASKPGAPDLCGGCIKNRELIAFRERENERLQARLAELLPDSPKAIEIRQRLRQDLGKYLNGVHYIEIIVRYGGKDIRIELDWVKELLR